MTGCITTEPRRMYQRNTKMQRGNWVWRDKMK